LEKLAITIFLLNPVYVAFFWAIVLHIPGDERNRARSFLGKLMIVAFVNYLSHFFFFEKMYDIYIWLDCFYHLASLSLYPMFYIYARLLVADEKLSFRKHYRYFVAPVFVFVALAAGYIMMEYEKDYYFISEVLYGVSSGEPELRYMQLILNLERIIFIGQALVYAYLITTIIIRHHKMLRDRYSSTEKMTVRWVQIFNITLFLSVLASSALTVIGRTSFVDSPLRLLFPSIIFSVVLFSLGALGNYQKQVIVRESNETSDPPEAIDARIPPKLKEELIAFFENRNAFLDKDLTIWDVAEKLGTNRTYVSRIINRDFGLTFSAFVNRYRIAYIKRLLDENPNYPADDLADIGGFGSPTSLYRAFLTAEKISMSEYRKLLKINNLDSTA